VLRASSNDHKVRDFHLARSFFCETEAHFGSVSSSFRRTGVLMAHGDECMQKKSFVSVRFVETFSRKRSGLNSMYSREVDELK
jgi:hypothetical protein